MSEAKSLLMRAMYHTKGVSAETESSIVAKLEQRFQSRIHLGNLADEGFKKVSGAATNAIKERERKEEGNSRVKDKADRATTELVRR